MKVRPNRWFIVTLIVLFALIMVACTRPARPNADEATTTAELPASGVVTDTTAVDSTGAVTNTVPADSLTTTDSPAPVDSTSTVTETAPTTTDGAAAGSGDTTTPPQPADDTTPATGVVTSTAAVTTTGTTVSDTVTTETPATDAPAGDAASGDTTAEQPTTGDTSTPDAAAGQTATPAVGTPPATEITYTVKPGESLYQIGLQYGYSWVVLAQYNNIPNPNYVVVGTVLKIPAATTPTTPTTPTEVLYTVKSGDTLGSIAAAYGVSWVQIAEANGVVNPNLIYPGQVLKIPSNTPGPTPQFTHVVQPGETLFLISLHYGVFWTDVAEANHISAPYIIFPGQTLTIPGGN